MTQPNMKKEYRTELKTIGKTLRAHSRAVEKIHRYFRQDTAAVLRKRNKGLKEMERLIGPLARRRDILKGRLS